MDTKTKEKRHRIATCLNSWRKNHSVRETAQELNIKRHQIEKLLLYSKTYCTSIYRQRNMIKKNIYIKNSPLRKRVAKWLRIWKKSRSLQELSRKTKCSVKCVQSTLQLSSSYCNRSIYTAGDHLFAERWAKKLAAINHLGGECWNCSERNPFKLQFHHINKNSKTDTISNLIHRNLAWKTIKEEADLCAVLCENCHAKHHHMRQKNVKTKQHLMKHFGFKACTICGLDDPRCLDFHHKRDRKYQISTIVQECTKYSFQGQIKTFERHRNEIEKCEIICSNCHANITVNNKRFRDLMLLIRIRTRLINTKYLITI